MARKIYYKVCYVEDEKFYSAMVRYSPFKTEYKLEEWTKPIVESSFLFVFKDIVSAYLFWTCNCFPRGKFRMFECNIRGPKKLLKICRFSPFDETQYGKINDFWKQKDFPKEECVEPIEKTIYANAIKLIDNKIEIDKGLDFLLKPQEKK